MVSVGVARSLSVNICATSCWMDAIRTLTFKSGLLETDMTDCELDLVVTMVAGLCGDYPGVDYGIRIIGTKVNLLVVKYTEVRRST